MKICVILLDALRADHLGCYGYPKDTSPHIDAIARRSLLFEHASSQAHWTYPSVYSMMTGRYPCCIQISRWDQRVRATVPVLPSVLGGKGYHSGFIAAYRVLLLPGCLSSHFHEARRLTMSDDLPGALDHWIRSHDDSFLLLHLGELIHEPFSAPRDMVSRFAEEGLDMDEASQSRTVKALTSGIEDRRGLYRLIRNINMKVTRLSRAETAYLRAAYDAGIRCVDDVVGKLYETVTRSGDDYLFVIIADHGQGFLEHGVFGHVASPFQELLHVPLIIDRGGDDSYRGRIAAPVELVDLFPTVLDLAGTSSGSAADGQSLWPLVKGETDPSKSCFAEAWPYLALRAGNHKLITTYTRLPHHRRYAELFPPPKGGWLAKRVLSEIIRLLPDKLFDLERDPKETYNLAKTEKERLRDCLGRLDGKVSGLSMEQREEVEVPVDEEIREELRALGYTDD